MIKAVIFDFYGVLNKEVAANEELIEYIKTQLKPRYKLGIISNAIDNFMYEIIPEAELRNIFDNIVVSHSVGVAKPEAAIYEISLRNIGVRANEAVFVDDIEAYCDAARTVGIQAVSYKNFNQMKTELEGLLKV